MPDEGWPGPEKASMAARLQKRRGWTVGQINAVSGAVAGLVAGIVVCPLDVVKTTLQVQGSFPSKGPPRYHGMLGTMRTLVRDEGVRGLYKGLAPMILGYLPTWTIYFYVYGHVQKYMKDLPGRNVLAAVTAGACSTVLTNPIWVVKTRLMTQTSQTPWHYTGVINAFVTMTHKEGLGVFYSGLGSALLGLPHVAIQFPLYEWLKKRLCPANSDPKKDTLRYLAASTLSKVVASTITYPHEVIRSRNQIYSGSRRKYRGILQTARVLYSEEGWRAFYAGLGTNICRAVPASAVTLATFELVSDYLENHLP